MSDLPTCSTGGPRGEGLSALPGPSTGPGTQWVQWLRPEGCGVCGWGSWSGILVSPQVWVLKGPEGLQFLWQRSCACLATAMTTDPTRRMPGNRPRGRKSPLALAWAYASPRHGLSIESGTKAHLCVLMWQCSDAVVAWWLSHFVSTLHATITAPQTPNSLLRPEEQLVSGPGLCPCLLLKGCMICDYFLHILGLYWFILVHAWGCCATKAKKAFYICPSFTLLKELKNKFHFLPCCDCICYTYLSLPHPWLYTVQQWFTYFTNIRLLWIYTECIVLPSNFYCLC